MKSAFRSPEGSKVVATQGGELAFEVGVAGGILSIRLAQDDGSIHYVAELGDGKDLRLFHDRGIVEIFADGGTVCGTRRGYANINPDYLKSHRPLQRGCWKGM